MKPIPELLKYGSRVIRLTKEPGESWIGSTGEPGFLLVLRAEGDRFTASLEHRGEGFRLGGQPKLSPGAAAASLLRLAKAVCRASGLRVL